MGVYVCFCVWACGRGTPAEERPYTDDSVCVSASEKTGGGELSPPIFLTHSLSLPLSRTSLLCSGKPGGLGGSLPHSWGNLRRVSGSTAYLSLGLRVLKQRHM